MFFGGNEMKLTGRNSQNYFPMRIILWAWLLATAWTIALNIIAHSPGLHSTPGIWIGVFGLPGVVAASWVRPLVHQNPHDYVGYAVMFVANWIFYCTVLQGIVSIKQSLSK
jgi:hypothetical protein